MGKARCKEGATIRRRKEEREARPRGRVCRTEKNLTGLPLVSLGSPNNGVRLLNKQQFEVIARHPRCEISAAWGKLLARRYDPSSTILETRKRVIEYIVPFYELKSFRK